MRHWLAAGVVLLSAAAAVCADAQSQALVERGKAALGAGEYAAAAQAFAEALAADACDVRAMHGAGLAAYHQGRLDEAIASLTRALQAAGDRPDRALVLNLAAMRLESGEAEAALKLAQDYLTRHRQPPDEPMLNAMGIALVQAMNQGAPIDKASQQYMEHVARLERTRPGMKRWGTAWVTAEQYKSLAAASVPEYPPLIELVALDAPIAGPAGTEAAVTDGGIVERPADGAGSPAAITGESRQALAIPIAPDLLLTPATSVSGASDVIIQSAEGESFRAAVVRVDGQKNLALLRVSGLKMHYLNLADGFDGGPVQCTAVTKPNLFGIEPATVAGTSDSPPRAGGPWTVRLERAPLLGGSPLTSNGLVIGVALGSGDQRKQEVPAIPVDHIRAFLGSDMPKARSPFKLDARSSVYQVIAGGRK